MPGLHPTTQQMKDWRLMKVLAWSAGRFETCRHRQCRKRKRCTGGPRGGLARFGVPACRLRDRERALAELVELVDPAAVAVDRLKARLVIESRRGISPPDCEPGHW